MPAVSSGGFPKRGMVQSGELVDFRLPRQCASPTREFLCVDGINGAK